MKLATVLASSMSRLRVFSLRELTVHRRRTVASIAVMAVSAMYLVAIFGIFGSITGSVNRLADGIAGIAALEVSGITDAGFPDAVLADVAKVPGVATAAPMIRMSAPTATEPVLLFGADDRSRALEGALKDAVGVQLQAPSAAADGVHVRNVRAAGAKNGRMMPECLDLPDSGSSFALRGRTLTMFWGGQIFCDKAVPRLALTR